MSQTHLFHLQQTKPQKMRPGGSRTDANAGNFPVLSGMSLSYLLIQPKAFREPHWHPNADELSYCLEGKGLMTIFGPNAQHDTFTIEPGEIVFVPMGSMHYIENIGESPLKMLICFDHERPEDLDLSTSIKVMPDHILSEAFQEPSEFFNRLQQSPAKGFIGKRKASTVPPMPFIASRYKFNLENVNPPIQVEGGWVKMSNSFLLPTLQGLSIYSVLLRKQGAREPHWHPNAHELNFLISGAARITLLSPDGGVDTFDMVAGDMSFLPRGYLHHIENTGNEDARFAIFFSNTAPSDIGISGCMGAYSNAVLADLFEVPADYFKSLPKYQQDLFVISGAG